MQRAPFGSSNPCYYPTYINRECVNQPTFAFFQMEQFYLMSTNPLASHLVLHSVMVNHVIGECSHSCPPQCQSSSGENSICFDSVIPSCLTRNGSIVIDSANHSFCVYSDRASLSLCNAIGANFLDCSLISPSDCFACEKVAI